MNNSTAIRVKNISKSYFLKHSITNEDGREVHELQALKNVSFEIGKGELIGIIGPNGSGKSTLLRILAGITRPSSGTIELYGKVASILDIGAGFHPELSGRENIFLNGQIFGFNKKEITLVFNEIVEFSGIGKFIEEPVKNYSNGMFLRLAFSIMACLEFDIYLLDEVLSVGDAEFRSKCQARIKELAAKKKTIIIISHNIFEISGADKIIYFQNGEADALLSLEDAIRKYYVNTEQYKLKIKNPFYIDKTRLPESLNYVEKMSFFLKRENAQDADIFYSDEPISVVINLEGIKEMFNVGICLRDRYNTAVLEISSVLNQMEMLKGEPDQQISFTFPARYFNANEFIIDLAFFNNNKVLFYKEGILKFKVKIEDKFVGTMYENTWGVVKPFLNWKIEKLNS